MRPFLSLTLTLTQTQTLAVGAIAALVLAMPAPALAAPQILALMETPRPVPLTCADGVCRAELAAFCMQQQRPGPSTGARYHIHDAATLTLTARGADGRQVQVSLATAEIVTVRSYKAVEVRIAEASLTGLTAPAVQVGPEASLVPVAVEGDGYPLGDDEIARVTGPMRKLAAGLMEGRAERRDAAVIVSHLVNALPPMERIGPAERDSLWDRTIGDGQGAWTPAGLDRARRELETCRARGGFFNWRTCLSFRQDMLIQDLNVDYWNAVKPGS